MLAWLALSVRLFVLLEGVIVCTYPLHPSTVGFSPTLPTVGRGTLGVYYLFVQGLAGDWPALSLAGVRTGFYKGGVGFGSGWLLNRAAGPVVSPGVSGNRVLLVAVRALGFRMSAVADDCQLLHADCTIRASSE